VDNLNSNNIEFEILYREFSFGNVRKYRIVANSMYDAMLRWSEDHKNDHFISIRYL
jgi:hypothetical protein